MSSLTEYLQEFAEIADDRFERSPFLREYYEFFQAFTTPENLRSAKWEDFQKMGEHIHALANNRLAYKRAFGDPNHPIEHYRRSMEYLMRGDDPIATRVDRFINSPTYGIRFLSDSSVSEIVGQAFADEYVLYNERDRGALEILEIPLHFERGDSFGTKFVKFNEAIKPVIDAYREIVGQRTDLPINLEVDQFFSWLYTTYRVDLKETDDVVLNEKLLARAVEQTIRPALEAGDFEKGGEEGYQHHEVLPKASVHLAIDALRATPVASIKKAMEAHQNLLHHQEITKASDFLDQAEEDLVRKHFIDLIYGEDELEERLTRFFDWATPREVGNKTLAVNGTIVSYLMCMASPKEYAFCKPSIYGSAARALLGEEHVEKDNIPRLLHTRDFYAATLRLLRDRHALPFSDLMHVHIAFYLLHSASSLPHWKDLEDQDDETEQTTWNAYGVQDALQDLFVDETTLREWLSILKVKKNIILQGPPGVGKTFIAKRLAYALMGQKDISRVQMVQFHQSYTYEDFIQGYRPTRSGGFELKNGTFYQFCQHAQADPGRAYVFIIDEINRGNLSKIFGELMMLIEPDKRGPTWGIPLTYADDPSERFFVPERCYIMGMMNTADRSLAMVDYALRRRFAFVTLDPRFESSQFASFLIQRGAAEGLVERIVAKMSTLNEKILADSTNLGAGFRIGHSYFCPADDIELDESWYHRVIDQEIAPLLREYWFDDPSKAEDLTLDLKS